MKFLVIGYGNRLRGDDGIGPAAAEIVASWQLAGVRVLALRQLVPELIAELRDADRVLFVDASAKSLCEPIGFPSLSASEGHALRWRSGSDEPYTLEIIAPKESRQPLGHHSDASHLLALTHELEGRCPQAWMLAIGIESLEYGESLSDVAQNNLHSALARIRAWLEE